MSKVQSIAVHISLVLAIIAGGYASLVLGEQHYSPVEIAKALVGLGEPGIVFVVGELRLPRLAVALVTGIAFGLAGMVLQTMTRNPLASPDILGIVSGAGTAAVALIVATGDYGGISGGLAKFGLPVAAFIGALVAALILQALTAGEQMVRVLIIGVGLHAMFGAATSWLILKASIVDAGRAMVWLTGSLNDANWNGFGAICLAIIAGLLLLIVYRDSLMALTLGVETAIGLGVAVGKTKAVMLVICVLLSATATAAVGPVAFVALGAPQLAQRLLRTGTPPIIGSMLMGAMLITWADWLGRVLLPQTLPVGVVTGALGAPLLVYLLISNAKGRA